MEKTTTRAAPMLLFTNTFAKQLGFSALTVGSIFTSMQIARVIGKLVFGALTDKLQAHKQIALMMYIPPLQKEIFSEIYCGSSMNIFLKVCSSKDFNKKSTCDSEATDFNFATSSIRCQMQCIVNQDLYRTECRNAGPPTTNICKLFQKGNADISTDRISLDGFSEWNDVSVLANEALHLKTNLTSSFKRMEVLGNKSSCFSFNVLSMEDTSKSTLVSSTDLLNSSHCKQNDVKLSHCRTTCNNPSVTELGTLVEVKHVTEEYQLWVFLVLLVLGCVGYTVLVSISDTMTFTLLGESSSDFGKVRLWGSVGWGTFTLISGKLVDELSEDKFLKNYSPAFISSAIMLSLDSLVVFSMKTSVKKKSKKLALDVGKILLNFETIIYLCWCISAGVCVGLCRGFFFWYIEDLSNCEDKASIKTMEGMYILFQSFLGELPFFFINARLSKKLGLVNCMSLVLLLYGIIFYTMSLLNNPWHFLPLALINGMAFSTLYSVMTSYANNLSLPGTETTVQSIVGSVYEGFGLSSGNFVAGLMMNSMSGRTVFKMFGIAMLILGAVHCSLQCIISINYANKKKLPNNINCSEHPDVEYSKPIESTI
ncbi:major facilitator superfamily domain-containing protein 6-A-like [Nilaparvata lugens]|uniref:major facilitator superfamily domain-containing protein 6-A-like n=1 Tax=Nilaparvata lugens TaxID=108931 RepID=UPI00193D1304|nr:major facilitator superfamily domain-containing protein 6-A-like [Nilaparvata lugens]